MPESPFQAVISDLDGCLANERGGPFDLPRLAQLAEHNRLAERDGECPVILPEVGVPGDDPALFTPHFSYRTAQLLGEEEVDGLMLARYRYIGDQYDESAGFWVDNDELLARYRWTQDGEKAWEVSLMHEEAD